jgi:hypothetical protein
MTWQEMAREAGFVTADDRLRAITAVQTNSIESRQKPMMRLIGEPTMPNGYVALVTDQSAIIFGPNGAYGVSWPLTR